MARTLKLDITETEAELKTLLRQQTRSSQKDKVNALYLLKAGKVQSLKDLAEVLARDKSTLYRWFQNYKSKGLVGLLTLKKHPGKKPHLPPTALQRLEQQLRDPQGFKSYEDIRTWLQQECGVDVSYLVVYRAVRYKLKTTLKVLRP